MTWTSEDMMFGILSHPIRLPPPFTLQNPSQPSLTFFTRGHRRRRRVLALPTHRLGRGSELGWRESELWAVDLGS